VLLEQRRHFRVVPTGIGVEKFDRPRRIFEDRCGLGILRIEEPERVLREPPRVLRAEPAGVRTNVLLQRLREVLARLPRREPR
jgi:hypothetical protein